MQSRPAEGPLQGRQMASQPPEGPGVTEGCPAEATLPRRFGLALEVMEWSFQASALEPAFLPPCANAV